MMKTKIKDYYHLILFVLTVLAATGGSVNIALNKPATQVSEEGSGDHSASKAVNGVKTRRYSNNIEDYSQTGNADNVRWWKVDLEGEYFIKNCIIYNRVDCCHEYLSNVYILTSRVASPAHPSPVSDDWIIRHYKQGPIGPGWFAVDDASFNLYTTDKVRHVAVYLHHSEPLSLREVEIYNYSHSEDAPVNQINSSTATKFNGTVTSPGAAADGNTNMFSAPFTAVNSQSSWVVKLKQSCSSFCYVKVYPRLVKNLFNDAEFTKLSRLQTLTYREETLPYQNADFWTNNCDIYEFPQKGPLLQICEASAIWFICLVNFDQGQIQFTEVQVFSRAPAEFQSINLQNQNYGCINISTPAIIDRATSYRFKCAGKDWSDRFSSSSAQSCGHEPGSEVTCEIVAVGEGGVSQRQLASVTLADCQAPSNASFTVRDIGTNAEESSRKIQISNIMVEFIRCNSLISLGINVNEKKGGNVRNVTRTANFYQDETIGDLKAYTDYTVYITAVNNRYKISTSTMELKTGELAPGLITTLTVQGSSSSCVNVSWSAPEKPNGNIISYKITCANNAEVNQAETRRQVCGYNPYQTVTCTVRAVNTYSGGEPTTGTGPTWCDRPSTPTFRLSQGTSGSPPRRFITVTNITVDKINCRKLNHANIKVYKGSAVIYNKQFNNQNNRTISDLDPVTEYSIVVTVFNDGNGGQAESFPSVRNIATGQLPPGPVASLTIGGHNSTCVNVNWTPPDKLSGEITSYKINCTSEAEVGKSETSLRVCGYNPYQNVTCTVRPVNNFGDGEQKRATGNTFCDKPSSPTFRLSQGTSGSLLRRSITVSDITVEKINCRQLTRANIKVYQESVLTYDKQFNNLNNRTISGLDAITQYRVVVTVFNDRNGNTTESDQREQTITTEELAPGVVSSVSIWSSSPHCVNLSWSEPAQPNGVIRSYSVQCEGINVKNLNVRTTSQCGFDPNQSVTCTIRALNNYTGVPTSRETTTQCDNPTTPNFTLYETLNADKSKRAIHVSGIWVEQLKCESLDRVEVTILNGSVLVYERSRPSSNTSDWFNDLTAVTNFTVRVIAVNNQGNRSQPTTKYITTGELAPWSPPARVGLALLNSTCGLLTWDKPLQPNGVILYYQVMCSNEVKRIEESLTATVKQYQFCGLKSASLVDCSVRANNTIGWSPLETERGYTIPELKEPLQLPELKPATYGIDIHISAVTFTNNESVIEYYQIIVEIVRGNVVSTRKRSSTDESLVDKQFLYNSTTAQSLNLTYYITARLYNQTDDLISFTCGDDQTYGGYYNQPLETGISYKIHYTYSAMLGEKLITYLYISPQVLTLSVTPTVPPSGSFKLIHLTALVILLLIPALITVITYVLIKRGMVAIFTFMRS